MADSTINGLTALVGSDVDQTADQFAVWDNSAATTKKITRTNVMNGPLVGDVGSAVRAAADSYGGVAFDGATSGTRITSSLTGQNIGTGDFSIWVRIKVPTANPSNSFFIAAVNNSATSGFGSNNGVMLSIESNGAFGVFLYVGSTFTNAFTVNGLVSSYGGQVVDVVLTRGTVSGTSTLTAFVNGLSVGSTSAAVAAQSVTSTHFHAGISAGKQPEHSCYRAVLFNRALSASDAAELSVSGVNPADQWGTQVNVVGPGVLNGDLTAFTAGQPDNWAATNYTFTALNPGVRITAGAGYTNNYSAAVRNSASVVAGKRYRMSITARQQTAPCGMSMSLSGSSSASDTVNFELTGSFQTYTYEVVATANMVANKPNVRLTAATASVSQADIYALTFTRIGAIVDLDLGCGIGYQAHDRSTNLLHGTLFGGISWTSPKKSGTVYGTTDTNGNQLLLGTTSIPANAVITSMVVNSFGTTPDITIGNVSGGTQLFQLGSLSGSAREILAPLNLPISTTGNVWIASNSSDQLNWTINYTTSF